MRGRYLCSDSLGSTTSRAQEITWRNLKQYIELLNRVYGKILRIQEIL